MSCAISVFDMLKVGIGPSSSHTLGPWKAASAFVRELQDKALLPDTAKVVVELYGSLALTGHGHGTDLALQLGLSGEQPEIIPVEKVTGIPQQIKSEGILTLGGTLPIAFDQEKHIIFHYDKMLPFHPNGMKFKAIDNQGTAFFDLTYFSIGGGFILKEGADSNELFHQATLNFNSADELSRLCDNAGLSISALAMINEKGWLPQKAVESGLDKIWQTMSESIYRGCHSEGNLPGGLNVARRAAGISRKLINRLHYQSQEEWTRILQMIRCDFQSTLKWVSCFAMAVNEENASFGRIVTAPTNGAAGVIPAVLQYLVCFARPETTRDQIHQFLLTASVIGGLFKHKATISAAMGGCQAEIGVSSSMAAAALTESLGGSPAQALTAAEIAMEHHLGLTCDPIKGLVQVPCIERNSMGAIKAITAANLALETDPDKACVSLDAVIQTMWETAQDMNHKYKETSQGGLATNVGIPEC